MAGLDPRWITLVLAILVAWMFYRRVRRLFGAQRVSVARLIFRVCFTGSLTIALATLPGAPVGVRIAGTLIGAVLGVIGVATTRLERRAATWHYVPNTLLGLIVLALLIGRMGYRAFTFGPIPDLGSEGATPTGAMSGPYVRGLLQMLFSYYATYYAGVLARCRWALGSRKTRPV